MSHCDTTLTLLNLRGRGMDGQDGVRADADISVVTSLLHHVVEGPVADDRTSSLPPSCCCWWGSVSCGAGAAGLASAGTGPGRGPQPAVWPGQCCAAVLPLCWPASPCLGSARCGLCLVVGGGGWCWCGAASHAAWSVAACNRGPMMMMMLMLSFICSFRNKNEPTAPH